jgi:hypothetical protein
MSVRVAATKEEYADSAIKLATTCKAFATGTLKQWRTEVTDEPSDWESLNEIRDLYLALETVEAKADLLYERALTSTRYTVIEDPS